VKYIFEDIHIYWFSSMFVPKGILENIKQLSYIFVWSRYKEKKGIALVK